MLRLFCFASGCINRQIDLSHYIYFNYESLLPDVRDVFHIISFFLFLFSSRRSGSNDSLRDFNIIYFNYRFVDQI